MNSRIKLLRKTLGLTQQRFAEKLGVKGNTISQYESGRNAPVDSVIALICREFNVSETWLRTGEGEMMRKPPANTLDALAEEYRLDKFGRTVIEKMVTLNDKQWEVLYGIVTEIVAKLSEEPGLPASAPVSQQEMTHEELHAELDRQLCEEKEPEVKSQASQDFSSSGTKLA